MKATLILFLVSMVARPAYSEDASSKERLLFLTPFVDYGFFDPVKKGVQDAARALGVHATFDGTPDGDLKTLVQKVKQGIDSRYDGIAVNIVDATAFDAVAAEARRKGIPLIAFNVDDTRTPNERLAAVGQHMLAAGRTFGREIAGSVAEHSHILLTMHDPGITALEERAAGIREELKSRSVRWTELITSTNREQAIEKIVAALRANPDIKILIGTGSADTEAGGLAIERNFPNRGYVVAGFDLTPDTLRMIKSGVMRFSIDQQPYSQGYYSVVNLTLYKRYGLRPANIDTGATIVSSQDVDRVLELSKQKLR